VAQAQDALNSRFTDMYKAFQYVDMNGDGSLDAREMRRALDMWNIPLDDKTLKDLMRACDANGSGEVDYKEFVDMLARDTVSVAALGKRGMQAKEAMGVSDMDAEFLGHGRAKGAQGFRNVELSANVGGKRVTGGPAVNRDISEAEKTAFVSAASEAINSRFGDMHRAFQSVDLDHNGTLNEKEIRRALDLWNIPMDDAVLKSLISACDDDGSGEVDYKEFVDMLARDTIAGDLKQQQGKEAELEKASKAKPVKSAYDAKQAFGTF